jgi:hypothetical protein
MAVGIAAFILAPFEKDYFYDTSIVNICKIRIKFELRSGSDIRFSVLFDCINKIRKFR